MNKMASWVYNLKVGAHPLGPGNKRPPLSSSEASRFAGRQPPSYTTQVHTVAAGGHAGSTAHSRPEKVAKSGAGGPSHTFRVCFLSNPRETQNIRFVEFYPFKVDVLHTYLY